jgi:hypothetical protein
LCFLFADLSCMTASFVSVLSSGFEPKTIPLHSSSSFSRRSTSEPLLLLLFTVDDEEQLFTDALEGEVDNDAMEKKKLFERTFISS